MLAAGDSARRCDHKRVWQNASTLKSTLYANMSENANKKIPENPDVVEKAPRRRFTAEYERRISLETECCTQTGEIGSLLRREGLYSSVVQRRRRQLREESLSSSKMSIGTPSPSQPSGVKEIASLKHENERLKDRLHRPRFWLLTLRKHHLKGTPNTHACQM